jgi:hypothetical protein
MPFSVIEVLCWCPDQDCFRQGITSQVFPDGTPLATLEGNVLIPAPGVHIDEIGPIQRNETTSIGGHHVNIAATGAVAQMLTVGLPQTGTIFERTHILALIPGLEWSALSNQGEPPGYLGPQGVKLFDRLAVNSRARVWYVNGDQLIPGPAPGG